MFCHRCRSLMSQERFLGESQFWWGFQCISCGNILNKKGLSEGEGIEGPGAYANKGDWVWRGGKNTVSDNIDPNEPYEEIMERLSRGISSWNFNFGTPESRPEPESPASKDISQYNKILAPVAKSRFIPLIPFLAVVLLVLAAGLKGTLWQGQMEKDGRESKKKNNSPNQSISMTKVQPVINQKNIEVPISMVEEKRLVSFEYPGSEKQIPLLAFQDSSGKIETAVGLSWPCNSRSFHIEGGEIVCDVCFTRWDLETLRGVSGECLDHPLEKVAHTIQDGRLVIRESDIQEWKPPMMRG